MKIILLFIYSLGLLASDYLVYDLNNLNSISRLNAKPVFSKTEVRLLKGSHVNTNIYKVKKTELINKDYIKQVCPNCRIEINRQGNLNSTNDPYSKYQWAINNTGDISTRWLSDIDTFRIQGVAGEDINFNIQENDKKIKVAIIDSGLDVNHPDLIGNLYTNESECRALEEYNTCMNTQSDRNICHEKYKDFDANGNGYALDCHGWSVTDKSNPLNEIEGNGNINDRNGHGTHIAGIIGAQKNNIGVTGAIQNVELLPIQVAVASRNNSNELATDKFAKGLLYAIKSDAQVVNMSLGWRFDQDSVLMRQMIELAHSKGIIVVAAAGNDSHSAPTYPCSYEEVICVGSHDVDGKISSFSNFGPHVDILAPGSNILSTWPTTKRSRSFTIDKDYEYLSGTSQATPYVTAILARLLNLGFSPTEARIKLLQGARKKVLSLENQIRNGNSDLVRSTLVSQENLVYPLTKAPALINWDKEEKSFKIKFKNYGNKTEQTKITLSPRLGLSQSSFALTSPSSQTLNFAADETKEIRYSFTSDNNVEGYFLFDLKIGANKYLIQAKALSLINTENPRVDLVQTSINDDEGFLINANFREFRNHTGNSKIDYLLTKEINEKTHIALLKNTNQGMSVSKSLRLPFQNSVIINLSRVDLDLDGEEDYVITLVNLEDRDNRETKFLAFDKDFKLKRILIAPRNTFNNDVTVLPGGFIWLKYNGRMVPSWITLGERPQNEREAATPWSTPAPEIKKNRLYLQLPEGLKTIPFNDDNEELPLHFLYQKSFKSKGEAIIVASVGYGFDKTYKVYKFSEKLEFIKDLNLETHFDLSSAKPNKLVNPKGENAFFHTPGINGGQNILSIEFDTDTNEIYTKQLKANSNRRNPIKFVLSLEGHNILSQTATRLIQEGDENSITESKINARRIKHKRLETTQALYLPSVETPGLGSELVQLNTETKRLYRPAHFQLLPTNGCVEGGSVVDNEKDKIVFICGEQKKFLSLEI